MVLGIALQDEEPQELRLSWSGGLSLTTRILAVNLFAILLVGGGLFFLDSYRGRLIEERKANAAAQVMFIARSLAWIEPAKRNIFLSNFAAQNHARIRIYDDRGAKIQDSFALAKPTFEFANPAQDDSLHIAARWIDTGFDFLVGAPQLPRYSDPSSDNSMAWPEISHASSHAASAIARVAPDGSHVISAGAISSDGSIKILSTTNARDIRDLVRDERFRISMFLLIVLSISILLSLFLARTIVRPLRHLARAAVKVRLGRAPGVTIPRLPSRRDEIGKLARALSDMSTALRDRIDATEAFAADVAHEIKNPLASLRSALDGIDGTKKPEVQTQLLGIAKADVQRLDRLISDISEASRMDSQLSKARFERIDIADMIAQLLAVRAQRDDGQKTRLIFSAPEKGKAIILGEDIRLERMLVNLIENALSFAPDGGRVELSAQIIDDQVAIHIMDNGPGIPHNQREAIFRRFYSLRPDGERFGEHSGLGLAIARNIIEGHRGQISCLDRPDGKKGAYFEILLPLAEVKF